ncbi:MAG TPA: VTT domain-containing protein [Candidatus Paceibacterota bacterium]
MDKKPSEQFNFIGAGIMLAALIALSFIVDVDTLKAWIIDAGVWAPVVFILLKISTVVIAPLSGSPLYPLIGLLFGFWPGLFYVALGDFIAYTLTFYISRIFGQKIVMKMISKKEEGLLAKIVEHIGTGKGFFHACLTCFALPELLSYGAGLSRIRYVTFILILWPAATVATGVLVLFGSSLSGSEKSLLISAGLPIVGAVAMLVGGSFFVKAIKRKTQ